MYINKIENRITFKIKSGYDLEILIRETMTLLGSIEKNINKGKNVENIPQLEITEVILVNCNLVKNTFEEISRVLHTFIANKSFKYI